MECGLNFAHRPETHDEGTRDVVSLLFAPQYLKNVSCQTMGFTSDRTNVLNFFIDFLLEFRYLWCERFC